MGTLDGDAAAQGHDLAVADLVVDLVVGDDEAELVGHGGQQLALDELVHDQLFEVLLLGDLRGVAVAAGQQVAVAKVIVGNDLAPDPGGVMVVAHRLLARAAPGLRPEVDDEDEDDDPEQDSDQQRPRIFPHLVEHGGAEC